MKFRCLEGTIKCLTWKLKKKRERKEMKENPQHVT